MNFAHLVAYHSCLNDYKSVLISFLDEVTRTRTLIAQGKYGGKTCKWHEVEKSTCGKEADMKECSAKGTMIGYWASWSNWSECKGTCRQKIGIRQRQRSCVEGGESNLFAVGFFTLYSHLLDCTGPFSPAETALNQFYAVNFMQFSTSLSV